MAKTYTLTLSESEYLVLKKIVCRRTEVTEDEKLQCNLSISEILDTRNLANRFLVAQPNQAKKGMKRHGKEKI